MFAYLLFLSVLRWHFTVIEQGRVHEISFNVNLAINVY